MRALLALGAFKEAPTNVIELNRILADELRKREGIEPTIFPIADGGDGTLDTINFHASIEGTRYQERFLEVSGPLVKKVRAKWLHNPKDNSAIIELAQASGISLVKQKDRDPLKSTTFGTGELILDAIKHGSKTIYLTVGGSATIDAGIGLLAALGAKFYDHKKNKLTASVENLEKIATIDIEPVRNKLKGIKLIILVDGPGCFFNNESDKPVRDLLSTAIQKFPDPENPDAEQLLQLRRGLQNIATVVDKLAGKKLSTSDSSGASGGVPFILKALLGIEVVLGSEFISQRFNLSKAIETSEVIITGEGFLDESSLRTKSQSRIIQLAKALGKRLIFFCGGYQRQSSQGQEIDWKALGIDQIIKIMPNNWGINRKNESIVNTTDLLKQSLHQLQL